MNDLSFYRLGRVVILVNDELGYNKDAQKEAFEPGVYRALTKAYARVNRLSKPTPPQPNRVAR